jgi:hypothetical protein
LVTNLEQTFELTKQTDEKRTTDKIGLAKAGRKC